MFQGLRSNSLFYILDKSDKPTLKTAQVVSVSNPQAKYGQYSYGDTTVDISVKAGEEIMDFKQLPSNLTIANISQTLVVSESREAMLSEVEGMIRISKQVLDSVPSHQAVIESCEGILRELNPQFNKEKEQEEKIGKLEERMDTIGGTLDEMMSMLSKALGNNKSKRNDND